MKTESSVVGLVQMKMSKSMDANLKNALKKVELAAKKGAKIICLPELYHTLYFPQAEYANKNLFAESVAGKSAQAFSKLAKKYGVVIVVPLYEKTKSGKFYNTAVVIDFDGKMLKPYRKNHIPQDPLFYEKNYFEEGDGGYHVYKTKYGDFSVLICFDQWYPEAARICALHGAQIIFYPTAIGWIPSEQPVPSGDWLDSWVTIQRSHAIANAVCVAAVNRTGKEGKCEFWGSSFVTDAFGKILKRASVKKEEIVIMKLDLKKNEQIQEGWGFFRNRRPDTYSLLIKKNKK